MDDKQLLWNRYEMHIELYKKYLDIVLKVNLFYYSIIGALLSFYFSHNANGSQMEWSLVIPILFGIFFVLIFGFAVKTLGVSKEDINNSVRDLGLTHYVRTDALVYLISESIILMVLSIVGLFYVFLCTSL